jgi:alkylation response protein AidB-like acyl-CoA dehydrogenase
MNFDFSDDQKLLQRTARDYLEEHCPLSVCREILESPKLYAEAVWKGAAELGWLGTAIPEEFGGSGLGRLELAVIATELGRALAPLPMLSSVYLATEAILLAGTDTQKRKYLPSLARGEAIGCFALAEGPGRDDPPCVETTFRRGTLSGVKVPVLDGEAATFAIVLARGERGLDLVLADLEGVSRSGLASIDPSRPLARLDFRETPAERLGEEGRGEVLAEHLLDRAAVLLAFEQIGGAERALELTREYTLNRYAFGRPIASYQALKHRMADHWCAIELARSNAYYGAWALSTESPALSVAACLARVSASEAFDETAADMIQMHGGVGFTWEFDCHLFYRRAKLASVILGTASRWSEKLIARLEHGPGSLQGPPLEL